MKKLIIAVATLMVAGAAFGQGQFYFSNKDLSADPAVNARFILPGDTGAAGAGGSSVGTDYTVTLMGGPKGGTLAALTPDAPGVFGIRAAAGAANAGYVNPVTVTVPGVAGGASADILVEVSGPGGKFSRVFLVPALGGGTVTPPTLPMGAVPLTLTPVPEPATLALGALGLGAMMLIRRRKQ